MTGKSGYVRELRAMIAWCMPVLAVFVLLLPAPLRANEYVAGQVWEYRTRPQDSRSLLKIGAITDEPGLGRVFHLTLVGVTPLVVNGSTYLIDAIHLPVSQGSLDVSVTRMSSTRPDFAPVEAGITEWRAANGGVFSIPVRQAIEFAETTIRSSMGTTPPSRPPSAP